MGFDVKGLLQKYGKGTDKIEAFNPPKEVTKKSPYIADGPVVKEPTEKEAKDAIYFVNLHGIKVAKKRKLPSGAYGEYVQLTRNIGIKLFKSGVFDSKEKALRSTLYKTEAPKELKNLREAREIFGRMAPLGLHYDAINYDSKWRVGVLVQHIDGTMLSELDTYYYDVGNLLQQVSDKARSLGYNINDLHGGNAMLVHDKGEGFAYVVDWGHGFSKI